MKTKFNESSELSIIEFESYEKSIKEALDNINAHEVLSSQKYIIVKPNLINSTPPPVTTPFSCCEAIIHYISACSDAEILIGEGCGDAYHDTEKVFKDLGYDDLSKRLDIPLVNLNFVKTTLLKKDTNKFFKKFYMPEIALSHYIISVPVLKAHSLAVMTGTLKNMMGFASPRYYQASGSWKKSIFHKDIHTSIGDLNRFRKPDLTIMDATIGLSEYHLGGKKCNPPLNKIIVGFDPYEVDKVGAGLLGFNWKEIPYLANGS